MQDCPYPRLASSGRAFVYVLPCRDEDVLKVGFSRDPFTRFSTLHRRFHRFFDLDRGTLVETARVREARRIERLLIDTFAEQRAMAPLVVREAAAGHTEWYRGIYPEVMALLGEIAAREDLSLAPSLGHWLKEHLLSRADLLHDWSARIVDTLEWARFNAPDDPGAGRLKRALVDTLDMFEAAGIDVAALVTERAWLCYREHEYQRLSG